MIDFTAARANMVDCQVQTNDVTDRRILKAMMDIPRERFVPAAVRSVAYMDKSLNMSDREAREKRFMMSPMYFAKLLQMAEIRENDLVLDIGCGTGYSTAIISRIAESVIGLEEDAVFCETAENILNDLGIDNAAVAQGKLTEGNASEGPFDAIVLEGKVEEIPENLFAQLKDGGRLAAIMENGPIGQAVLFRRINDTISSWPGFDANSRLLPGFEKEESFQF